MDGEDRNLENIDRYIGKRIGNYRIDALLNSGAFGRVYKGVHLYLTHRVVAIKLLHATHLASSEERENFLQEAQFLELLKHAHILPIYDVGIDEEGFPYLVAEFAAGGSLRERIKQQRPQFLPLDEVLRILSEIGQALQFVHEQNIVHRDLKPENILFTAKDEAMLADFGIAVFLETTQTRYANVIGSPLYMAPEQFDGIASRRSDQYSLACIAYEMLAGRPPFVSNHPLTLGMKHQNELPVPPSQFNSDIPEHIETALLKALAKKRDERYPDINAFITALISVPSGPLQRDQGQWLIEGQNLLHSRRYRQALVAFERALRYDPALVQAYEGKGEALLLLGQLNEALTAYDEAIRLSPHSAAAVLGKGKVLYDMQDYAAAIQAFDQAISLDAALLEAYIGKGNALYYLGRDDEAIVVYDEAIQRDAHSNAAYDGKGWALWHAGRYQEALAAFEQALQYDAQNASSHTGKGKALYHLGRYEQALRSFEQAILLAPDLDRNYEYRADALYRLQRYEEALQAYEQSIELKGDVPSSHEGRAWVLLHLQRNEEALEAFERAIKLNPQAAYPHYGKGNALCELGQYEEALDAYNRAIRLNPRLAAAYNGRGNALANLKYYTEALAAYEKAIQLQPSVAAFYSNKADTLRLLGRNEEAQQVYLKARQLGSR